MEYSNFLDSVHDTDLRNKLWSLFNHAEKEAKEFSVSPDDWVDIKSVIASPDQRWKDNGEIEISPKWDDLGQIFHETFHSAFHYSPLWTDPVNNTWGDGFCDAFRYFMEDRLLSDSKWLTDMKRYLTIGIEEIIKTPTNISWKLEYCIPASRIINEVGMDYGNFKRVWKVLNIRCNDPLEAYFKFPKRKYLKRFGLGK